MSECKSIIDFPNEYVMLDIETTGLSPEWDEIIEIGALRVRDNEVVDSFQTFVSINEELDEFITQLTGITNEMLVGAPGPKEAIMAFQNFLGSDIIIGYNVKFDINFINAYLERELSNNYIDCMRLARRLYPSEQHHRLKDMRKKFNINAEIEHRASNDCLTTKEVFENLRRVAIDNYGSIDDFKKSFAHKDLKAGDISTKNTSFDVTHPLFGMTCVFTGTLEKMTRREAMQAVVDVGGIVGDNVTKNTNFLVLGNNDYCSTIKDGKSTKQKKAESLMLKGQDISVIPENVFYQMLDY